MAAGANHFLNPEFYLAMMPDYLPAHLFLVQLSGVLEIVGGVLVLPRRSRAWAGVGLVLLLVGVFPANLNMALNPERFPQFSSTLLWGRLPVQVVLIAWAWWATRPEEGA